MCVRMYEYNLTRYRCWKQRNGWRLKIQEILNFRTEFRIKFDYDFIFACSITISASACKSLWMVKLKPKSCFVLLIFAVACRQFCISKPNQAFSFNKLPSRDMKNIWYNKFKSLSSRPTILSKKKREEEKTRNIDGCFIKRNSVDQRMGQTIVR